MSVQQNQMEALGIRPSDRVLVLGGYGTGNVGDEAILSGLLRQLHGNIRSVQVISASPADTMLVHGVSAVSPLGGIAALARADMLIVGGGGIFSGHMGRFGQLIPFFGLLARMLGKRVAFHGVGVYPSTPRWVQRSLRFLGPHLTCITVRDRISEGLLRSWGIQAGRVMDLSSHMPPAPPEAGLAILDSLGIKPDVPIVGLCLTIAERSLEAPLLETLPKLIREMADVQFCFVPMSRHLKVPHHNDLILGRRLQAITPELSVVETVHHPSELLALFAHFRSVICMRYHSLLFAKRVNTPIVAVTYAEKGADWLDEHGMRPTPLDSGALVSRLREILVGADGGRVNAHAS